MTEEQEEQPAPRMSEEQMEAHEAQARKNAATMATNSLLSVQRMLAGELASVIDPQTGNQTTQPDGRRITRIMELTQSSESLARTIVDLQSVNWHYPSHTDGIS